MQLEEKIIRELQRRNYTVTTAESCTGGMIASAITDVPGASAVFEAGFVTYSNAMKTKLLAVPEETLARVGAVSAETVEAMAKGAANVAEANVAVAVSGIAGPGGGTPEKPVGLVYICLHIRNVPDADGTYVYKCNFSGSRDEVRRAVVEKVFEEMALKLGL